MGGSFLLGPYDGLLRVDPLLWLPPVPEALASDREEVVDSHAEGSPQPYQFVPSSTAGAGVSANILSSESTIQNLSHNRWSLLGMSGEAWWLWPYRRYPSLMAGFSLTAFFSDGKVKKSNSMVGKVSQLGAGATAMVAYHYSNNPDIEFRVAVGVGIEIGSLDFKRKGQGTRIYKDPCKADLPLEDFPQEVIEDEAVNDALNPDDETDQDKNTKEDKEDAADSLGETVDSTAEEALDAAGTAAECRIKNAMDFYHSGRFVLRTQWEFWDILTVSMAYTVTKPEGSKFLILPSWMHMGSFGAGFSFF